MVYIEFVNLCHEVLQQLLKHIVGFLGYDAQPCTLCNHIAVSPNILLFLYIVVIDQMWQLNEKSTHYMNLGQQTKRGCFTWCSQGNRILYLPCLFFTHAQTQLF